jgi:predicted TIM-barrel fold metal-dependent hydrolase
MTVREIEIVDSHIHLWGSDTAPPHHRRAQMMADEALALMREAGVDRAVNCPPIWDAASNSIANVAAQAHPDVIATTGWIPVTPFGDGRILSGWKAQPGMRGLRLVLMGEKERQMLERGELDWIFEAAAHEKIPVALTAPLSLAYLGALARRFPSLSLAVDHMGLGAFGKAPDCFAGLPTLLALADLPNVSVKVSAAPGYATDGYPFRSVHPYLREIHDAFGSRRLFWGTDITRMPCSWRECVTMFTDHLDFLDEDDLHEIMGRAIRRWLGW